MNKFTLALSFDDVLLKPKYSKINSRSDVDLTSQISDKLTLKIPLIPTNMDTITGVDMAIKAAELGGMAVLPRFQTPQIHADYVSKVASKVNTIAASVGVKEDEFTRAEMLVKAGANVLDIDTAHGHLQKTIEATRKYKEKYENDVTLLAGIAATYEAAVDLYKAGADCVTVGVGGGSICTTRIETGSGMPTFASLLEVSKAAKEYNKTFMPVAGIKNSGDIVKSLATGACAIRGGNIFSGTDECPGELVEVNGKKYKRYNGSTSKTEKIKQFETYRTGKSDKYTVHIEGVEGLKEYKGTIESVFEELLAGIRSGLSYSGANNLKELVENAEFIQITQGGIRENGAHDIFRYNLQD